MPATAGANVVRQQVGNPYEPAAALGVGEYLRRGVVVRQLTADSRPHEPAAAFVDIDDQLAQDHSVAKGHDPSAIFETDVGHHSGCETGMNRPNVPKRRPYCVRIGVNRYLTMNGSHMSSHRTVCPC